jgi:hypothetical protein
LLYFINRLLLKPSFYGGFFHTSLNDLICIPFWIPIMLWTLRKVGLRKHDDIPQCHEILVPLLIWSWYFELWLPHLKPTKGLAHADVYDILFYVIGALIAFTFWRYWYLLRKAENAV